RDDRREPREDRRDDRREPREDRRDYRRDRDLGPSVIGMGDHVPDFILRSFALKAAPTEEVEEPVPATGTEG
ncbi:MAG: DEAD/DEAH box helicase, partial [Tabrizicola sp.]